MLLSWPQGQEVGWTGFRATTRSWQLGKGSPRPKPRLQGGKEECKAAMHGAACPQGNQEASCKTWALVSQPVTANGKLPEEAERKDCLPFPSFLPLSPLCLSSSRPSSLCAASSGVGGCRGAGCGEQSIPAQDAAATAQSSCTTAHAAGIHPSPHTVLCSSHAKGR